MINYSNTLYEMYANTWYGTLWCKITDSCTYSCANACLPTSEHGAWIHILSMKMLKRKLAKLLNPYSILALKYTNFAKSGFSQK